MILEVIVDISTSEVDRTFDYIGDDVPIGSRVTVEFGRQKLIGFVIGKKENSAFQDKLKRATYLDTPIDDNQLALCDYMRVKYNLRQIDVLRLFVPSKLRDEKAPETTKIYLVPFSSDLDALRAKIGKNAKKQLEAFDYLAEKGGEYNSVLADKFSQAVAKALYDKGVALRSDVHERQIPLKTLQRDDKKVVLTPKQSAAVEQIASKRGAYLIHGVTGSGKTEVYKAVIDKMLAEGKSAIMLVPEISLTPQMLGIFRARFGDSVAILHSGLNATERYDEWKRLRNGEAKIALGARSAIFAPMQNLGVIIIDEEHDASYVSENNPRYDTRDVAEFRAKQAGATLILGSATPDIETYAKATEGQYDLITLPDRVSKFKLSDMEVVDMMAEFRQGNRSTFSIALVDAIRQTLARGEQVMIFLNRRGYASYIRCPECGWVAKCANCDVSLTYHRDVNRLKCHYCGQQYTVPTKCPNCGSTAIKHGRTGTEKVASELSELFHDAKILRMDNDTTRSKDAYFNILDRFAKHQADILVGTQMIAKGHDFASVTLVGILEADAALYFSDYRSSERTFQLVTQVAGRAGRADKAGRVIMQTYLPRNYVFYYAKNYDYQGFFTHEINLRRTTNFPPYTKLLRVLIASEDEKDALDCTRKIYRELMDMQDSVGQFVYLGANRAPMARMNAQCRYQVLVRMTPQQFEQHLTKIYDVVNRNKIQKGTCFAEINPQSLV